MISAIQALIIGIALIIGGVSTLIFKNKKDNAIEQIAEAVIKEETGLEIDFTPTDTKNK